jgi:hypothetical protein
MTESIYLLDFRRMTVEKIADPKSPGGIDAGAPALPEGTRQAGITFTVGGSEPVPENQEQR